MKRLALPLLRSEPLGVEICIHARERLGVGRIAQRVSALDRCER